MQNWVNEMAAYVKSLDSNHLLTVGEEGFYTSTQNQTYCNPSSSARKQLSLNIRCLTLGPYRPKHPVVCRQNLI